MQDSEPGSDAKVKDFFVNVVHISGDNYDKLKASVIKQAASLKSRVESKDILLDLDFEGTMKKICAKDASTGQPDSADSRHSISSGDYFVRWSLGNRCEESASGCDDGSAFVESRCGQVASVPA